MALSPIVLHRPGTSTGSACQPAAFATAVATPVWLELEVAQATEVCNLVSACPDQEQLGKLCTNAMTNASLFVHQKMQGRVQGRAVVQRVERGVLVALGTSS